MLTLLRLADHSFLHRNRLMDFLEQYGGQGRSASSSPTSSATGLLGLRLDRTDVLLRRQQSGPLYPQQGSSSDSGSSLYGSSATYGHGKSKRRSRSRLGPSPLGLQLGRSAFEERRTKSGKYVPIGSTTEAEDSKTVSRVAAAYAAARRAASRTGNDEKGVRGDTQTASVTPESPREMHSLCSAKEAASTQVAAVAAAQGARQAKAVGSGGVPAQDSDTSTQEDVWTAGQSAMWLRRKLCLAVVGFCCRSC